MSLRLAFVIPWYGPNVPGGAETATRHTAEHLAAAGLPVDVLTTCIRDLYADWSHNHHRPGVSQLNGVTVRRFAVGPRDRQAFDRVNWRLMHGLNVGRDDAQTFLAQMFSVPDLYEFISRRRQDYLFFFTPYMFATSVYGAALCPERAVVIPCLHDEAYARLDIYRPLLQASRALLFYSDAEAALAARLAPPPAGQIRQVVGSGVEGQGEADPARFRRRYGLNAPFVLYAGRREAGKNLPLLLEYWDRYLNAGHAGRRGRQLVLIGPGELALPASRSGQVVDLGFVPAADKRDAMAAATVLCQPSVHESFSLVLMESWLAGRPVLVHAACPVTREACLKANGGLYFGDYDEFAAALDWLFDRPALAATLGAQGRRYVEIECRWDIIVARYRAVLARLTADVTPGGPTADAAAPVAAAPDAATPDAATPDAAAPDAAAGAPASTGATPAGSQSD